MSKNYMLYKSRICYVFIIATILIDFGCNSYVKTNVIQSSFDVKQSKELGVFIKEYTPLRSSFVIGGKEVNIIEAWEEHYWEYKNQKREIEEKDGTEGYVKIDTELSDLFDINFIVNNRKNGISGNKLTFEPVFDNDTLTFLFYNKEDTVEILFTKK